MSSKKINPLDQARGILGEHMKGYVILCVSHDAPNTLQIRTDNKYGALGMVTQSLDVLNENIVDDGWEIVWDEEEDEEN